MKNLRKVLFCLSGCFFLMTGMLTPVFAAQETNDGLTIDLVTDQESYSETDPITATLSVLNTSSAERYGISMEVAVPEGYHLDADSIAKLEEITLLPDESKSLAVKLIPDEKKEDEKPDDQDDSKKDEEQKEDDGKKEEDKNETPASSGSDSASGSNTSNSSSGTSTVSTVTTTPSTTQLAASRSTASNSHLTLTVCGLVLGLAGLIVLAVKSRKARKTLSVLICIGMSALLLPNVTVRAEGEENSQLIETEVSVADKTVKIQGTVTFKTLEEILNDDRDGDHVPNYIEDYFGTDKQKDDTDDDGLNDYVEIFVLKTDPTKQDTDDNGVLDGDEDADQDGLTNLEEIQRGTDPVYPDSDRDGLSDAQELNVYKTDPVNEDTDGDGILDGDEIILGLDPLNPASDGTTNDGDRLFEQGLSEEQISADLLEDNLAIPGLTANVPGVLTDQVYLEQADVTALAENRAAVGQAVEVISEYPEDAQLTLHFDISQADNPAMCLVCTYVDGEIVPCESVYDESAQIVSAQVTGGIYFVMDAEKLLAELNIRWDRYISYPEMTLFSMTADYAAPLGPVGEGNEVSSSWYDENYTVIGQDGQMVDLQAPAESEAVLFKSAQDVQETEQPEESEQPKESEEVSAEQSVLAESIAAEAPVSIADYALKEGEQKVLTSSLYLPALMTERAESTVNGQADIVFVIDTTGSMSWAINNVVYNVDTFVDILDSEYSVNVNFALVDYKDITCDETTVLVKNGSSNWFTDPASFKRAVNSLYVFGGGDNPETPIDGLGMAEGLDFRPSADKFVILITDVDYKNDNNYGISSMDEMADIFAADGINVSVISDTYYKSEYSSLFNKTGGIFGDIYSDFYGVLLELADKIGEIVNDGSWVILSDYQFIKLDQPLDDSGYSSDDDKLSDREELGEKVTSDITPYLNWVMKNYDIPEDMYTGPTSLDVYKYKSHPLLEDTDYDGRDDDIDSEPKSNKFKGTLHSAQADSSISMTMDYREFFKPNTTYSTSLSKMSSLYAAGIYSGSSMRVSQTTGADSYGASDLKLILDYFGFKECKSYNIGSSDNHRSEIAVGYRTVTYNKVKKTILAVIVRGTNGTIEEWSSNFDIGDASTFSSTSEWTDYANHKGFDIVSNRIMSQVSAYVSSVSGREDFEAGNTAYWVTGHSRGAAVANLVGAKLVNRGEEVFAYTFAAPNTTTDGNAHNGAYNCIFNVVNSDDFVPCLPMSGWGYTRYGKTSSVSIKDKYEKKWETLTGIWDYNPDTYGLDTTVNNLTAILSGDARKEAYAYTCDDHGDGSNDTITIKNRGMSKSSREEAIAKIPTNALPYCKITRYDGGWVSGWDFEVCQTPAYFMQILAAKMGGTIGNYRFVVELNIAKRYEAAKSSIISSALGGVEHPHYVESYYLLADQVRSSSFK